MQITLPSWIVKIIKTVVFLVCLVGKIVRFIVIEIIWGLLRLIGRGLRAFYRGTANFCYYRSKVAAGCICALIVFSIWTGSLLWAPMLVRWPFQISAFKPATTIPVNVPMFVLGKGMWIYQIGRCDGGNIPNMVARAKDAGLDYVLVKTHDGSKWVSYNSKQKVQEIITAFHAEGMKVLAWGYVYGRKPEEEAARAIDVLQMGCDGYIWNAEVHMRNKPSAAEIQCSLVRNWVNSNDTSKVLGYSTFCRVQNQAGIPFEVYDRYCDVAMPQVYFSWFSHWTAKQAAAKTMAIWQSEQAGWGHYPKPIIPTLECSSGAADMPATRPSDLEHAAKGFRGYYGINFYVWDVSTEALWAKVKSAPGSLQYQQQKNAGKAWEEAKLIGGFQ